MSKPLRKTDNSSYSTDLKTVVETEKPTDSRLSKKQLEAEREPARGKYFMPPEEEKASVLEIIADLEKQLEVAFSIKDEQAKEITRLEKELEKAGQRCAVVEAKIKEMQGVLVSQEKMNFNLEFLENERLGSIEKTRNLEEELNNREQEKEELKKKMEELAKEVKVRETRLEQIEMELNSAHTTIQAFQNRIHLVQEEKEEYRKKFEEASEQVKADIVEKEEYKRELQQAKESLDEIRVMLTDTRAKARGHYYKKKA